MLTIFNTFKQFSNFNLIITEDRLFKVILVSSAAKRHKVGFYDFIKIGSVEGEFINFRHFSSLITINSIL